MPGLRQPAWIALALGALVIGAFWGVRECQFINVDDPMFVAANPHLQNGLTRDALRWAATADLLEDSPNADYWQPVTMISHALTFQWFGDHAGRHHLVNLALHVAVALLLFHVLRLMTGAVWRSALVAALFALHPARVESVAWVTERKDMLAALFWVLTMWAYRHYTRQPDWKRYMLVLVGFALALMSKPIAVTLPCALLLLDFWPLNRLPTGWNERRVWVSRVVEKIPLFLMALVSAWITSRFQPGALQDHSPSQLLLKAMPSAAAAFSHQILPVGLTSQYPRQPLSTTDLALDLSLLVVLILAFRFARSRPWWVTGWLWFLGTLAPSLFLNDIVTADRFSYIPCIGLFLVVSWGAAEAAERCRVPIPVRASIAGAALLLLAGLTHRQVGFWKDSEALARRGIEINPDDSVAHYTLGTGLVGRGRHAEALPHLERALGLRNPMSLNNLGTALAEAGRADLAQESYRRAIALKADYALAHYNLGALLCQAGDSDAAMLEFEAAVRIEPVHVLAWNALGNLLRDRGGLDDAITCFRAALKANPDFAKAHHNLAICLAREGRLDEAVRHFREAIRLSPREVQAHCNLGDALARQGRRDEAIACYEEALRLQPGLKQAQAASGRLRKAK